MNAPHLPQAEPTPEQLRARAASLREYACYADGPACNDYLREASALEARARQIEQGA